LLSASQFLTYTIAANEDLAAFNKRLLFVNDGNELTSSEMKRMTFYLH